MLEPFAAETGIDILVEVYNGGLAQVRAQVKTGNVHWDLVDLEMSDVLLGCDEGLLELVEAEDLAPAADSTPRQENFFPGTFTDCGGAFVLYSTIYAYNAESFPNKKPATMADLFDTEQLPGRRGMRRVAQANLEFALMADGVPISDVYATLGTGSGMARAFRKLDTIKDDIAWWETSAQNMVRALPINSEWWSDHADEVNERFSAWLAR